MELNDIYLEKEYNTEIKEKQIGGIHFIDLRYTDEFELLFLTSSAGAIRFKKRYNLNNKKQLEEILLEDLKFEGVIHTDGKLILNKNIEQQLKTQQDEQRNNNSQSQRDTRISGSTGHNGRINKREIRQNHKEYTQRDLFSDLSTDGANRNLGGILSDEASINDEGSDQNDQNWLESYRSRGMSMGGNDESESGRTDEIFNARKNARNFIIKDREGIVQQTGSSRIKNNIEALKVLVRLEKGQDQEISWEDQEVLAKFSGFGGFSEVLYAPTSRSFQNLDYGTRQLVSEIYNLVSELDPDESKNILNLIKSSSLTAYYTPHDTIQGIYDIIGTAQYSGTSLNILEPSMGSGNFFGNIPEKFKNNSNLYGVEMDYITGNIAKYLYPDAKINIKPFQETNYPKGYFDLIVGNIPFGDIRVFDESWKNSALPAYKFAQQRIHNYFIVKSIELAKEGGIIALMTSSTTLDSQGNDLIRKYIAENTEFLGAIRMPNNTFKRSNTEVVTDILFLRKFHEGEEKIQNHNFLDLKEQTVKHKSLSGEYETIYNTYFHDHPKMMLGIPAAGGMYSSSDFTLLPDLQNPESLRELIRSKANLIIPEGLKIGDKQYKKNKITPIYEHYTQLDKDIVKDGNLAIQGGKIGFITQVKNEDGDLELKFIPTSAFKDINRIGAFIHLRTALTKLMLSELYNSPDPELDILRTDLNTRYQQFTNLYGSLHQKENEKIITQDSDVFTILALEKIDKDQKVIGLADIFKQKTVRSNIVATSAATPQEAINLCYNELGRIEPSKMEVLLGKNWRQECKGFLFELPNTPGKYVGKEEYLCGNVREKLQQAQAAVSMDEKFRDNVIALENIQPRKIPANLIDMRLGARWIPEKDYTDFFKEIFQIQEHNEFGTVFYNSGCDEYKISHKGSFTSATNLYSGGGKTGVEIAEAALEDRHIKIFYKDDEGKSVFDAKATQAANEKVKKIKGDFQKWLSKDKQRRERLAERYNEIFNSTVLPKYDGSGLIFPGYMGPELRAHQKDATYRLLRQNGGLIDHCVGAGKTLVMINTAMEMRRTGIAKKPMIIALKSTVPQIHASFKESYPFAKILSPGENDFSKQNRQKILGQIAVNDWDCIILSHEQYGMLQHIPEIENSLIQEEINLLQATVESIEKASIDTDLTKRQKKGLEKRIENLTAKTREILSRPKDNFAFEKLGIDHMMVDESHYFKNLPYSTKHTAVAGLGDPSGSLKTRALLMGCRALQQQHNGDRGITFLSGTPISNSLVELYLINRYLCPHKLKEMGLITFDAWASVFAERSTEVEFSVTGELKLKDRFRRFTNVPELAKMYAEIADVRNDKNLKLPKPDLDIQLVNSPLSPIQQKYMNAIIQFAKSGQSNELNIHGENKRKAKMLVATGLSAKVAMDVRLIDEKNEDEITSKVSICARKVAKIYQDSSDHKGVQLIFSDLGTPSDNFNVYDEIKRKLIEDYNIPASEIAFIHEATTDIKKDVLFKKVNAGECRIMLGSTQKMGTGTNVQEKIATLHHLDVPWTPASFEQRNGRGARQGNNYAKLYNDNKVQCYVYAVEKSLDAYKYQLLEIKQNIINQVKDGSISNRCIDEGASGDNAMSFAEFVAILSGNPIILEKAKIDKKIYELETSNRIFEEEKFDKQASIGNQELKIEKIKKDTSEAIADMEYFKKNGFSRNSTDNSYNYLVEIDGKHYDKPSEAGQVLLEYIKTKKWGKVLSGYGVDMYLSKVSVGTESLAKYSVIAPSGLTYGNKELSENPTHAGMAIINAIEQADRIAQQTKELPNLQAQLDVLRDSMSEKWQGMLQLEELYIQRDNIKKQLEEVDKTDQIQSTREIEENDISDELQTEKEGQIIKANESLPLDIKSPESINSIIDHEIQQRRSEFEENTCVGTNEKRITEMRKSYTKNGTDIWLVGFNVVFDYDIYKKQVEPLIKSHAGFWNKSLKAVIFKSKACANLFNSSISRQISDKALPFEWKRELVNNKSKIQKAI